MRALRIRVPVAGWIAAAFLGASRAGAAEVSIRQPSVCDIGDELSFRAEQALGQPLATAPDVQCTIHIERAKGAFAARLELGSRGWVEPPRQRFFTAPTCEKLAETLALAVVLAIGGRREEPAASASTAQGPNVDADASTSIGALALPADDLARLPVAEVKDRAAIRWGGRAALVLDAGTLPTPALGASLGASVGGQVLEARLLGTYLLPQTVSVDALRPGSPGAELGFAAASMLACKPQLVRTSRLDLGTCLGVELGALWGRGARLSVSRTGLMAWYAARGDLGVRWGFGPRWLGLDVLLTALVPLRRADFVISNDGDALTVHRPAAVEARASVGISVELD